MPVPAGNERACRKGSQRTFEHQGTDAGNGPMAGQRMDACRADSTISHLRHSASDLTTAQSAGHDGRADPSHLISVRPASTRALFTQENDPDVTRGLWALARAAGCAARMTL